ncbi:hypothetical protein [Ancylobacter sp. IITR112]|uniref:hypothetical protein n=1 Tax=Ancylobacter sp. IITR112 TaxID=3138073 RepID=UPI00352BB012
MHIFDAVDAHFVGSHPRPRWFNLESVMSTEEESPAQQSRAPESRPSERWDRAEQSAHWREIGISAVAAAARYASSNKTVSDAPVSGAARTDDAEAKIVTLRDVEYFAA